MTKEQFIQLGLTEEQAKKCAEQSKMELKNYVAKQKFDEANSENEKLKESAKENEKALETLKKSAGNKEELTAQIEKLQEEAKETEKKHEQEMKEMKLNSAIKIALGGKVQDEEIVSGLINKEKLIVGEDGKVVGLEEQVKALKESKAFLFKEEKEQVKQGFMKIGAEPPTKESDENKSVSLKDAVTNYFQQNK